MKTRWIAALTLCGLVAFGGATAAWAQDETPVAAAETPQPQTADHITQYGITWTFDRGYPTGTYCTGDHWVVGPVTVVAITTDLHAAGFAPKAGEDGSMVNPPTTGRQGYDNRLSTYDASLNAALPGGKPIAADNPLVLEPGTSLVSMVSWLYRSPEDTEPGCPRFNAGTKTPRPAVRSGAVLTCVAEAPPAGSFRPPYCGGDKSPRFNKSQLDYALLAKLAPVASTPPLEAMERAMARPWFDHVHEYAGAYLHPSANMPQYGQHMGQTMIQAALMLQLDFDQLPGKPSKERLCVEFVQYGIDLAGIADNGGGWPANGGHQMGRKWPILFAGLMLGDEHMKSVGQWATRFQEDEQTFYVSQADVDMTHSPAWNPDKRSPRKPYTAELIGLPEWGIRHASKPQTDNYEWKAVYRGINGSVYPGFVMATLIMGQKAAWHHDALFDYSDRWMARTGGRDGSARLPAFAQEMWKAYRAQYGPVWQPEAADE